MRSEFFPGYGTQSNFYNNQANTESGKIQLKTLQQYAVMTFLLSLALLPDLAEVFRTVVHDPRMQTLLLVPNIEMEQYFKSPGSVLTYQVLKHRTQQFLLSEVFSMDLKCTTDKNCLKVLLDERETHRHQKQNNKLLVCHLSLQKKIADAWKEKRKRLFIVICLTETLKHTCVY